MSRLRRIAASDLRLQWRHGIVAAVAVVTVLWVLLLRLAPVDDRATLLPLVIYTDAGVIGLTFVGGQVLIERQQRVLAAVGASPVRAGEYVGGKLASLTLLALVGSALIVVGSGGAPVAGALLMLPGVLLLSLVCLSVGLVVAARATDVARFLIFVQVPLLPVALPLLALTGWVPWALADPVPTAGPLRLVAAAVQGQPPSGAAWAGTAWAAAAAVIVVGFAIRTTGDRLFRTPAPGGRPAPRHAGASPEIRRRPRGRVATLVAGDLRRGWRDPVIGALLVGPLALALVARWVVPVVGRQAAARLGWDLAVHRPTMLALVLIVVPLLLGSVAGLLLVSDREEGVLRAVLVTPVPRGVVVGRRAALATLGSGVALGVAVPLSGLTADAPYPVAGVAAAVVVASLLAPVFALLLPAVARNRLESMAVMKVLPLPVFAPLLVPYLDGVGVAVLAPVPSWWLVATVQAAAQGRTAWLPALCGVVVLGGFAVLAQRVTVRRLEASPR